MIIYFAWKYRKKLAKSKLLTIMNLYMQKIKSPDTLTIEEIQSISEKTKHTIRSYLEVSEEIKKVTELFRLILSANTEILLRK